MKVLSVVGARPNFMKLAPLARSLSKRGGVKHVIVHTGQHYDVEMSASFFCDLGIPEPDVNLEVGSGSHAQQTAQIMGRIETVLLEQRPDVILVYGDVNSTVAAALVASKLGVKVGHVEAGLRSRDWSMPEEINRVVTDRLANLLFTPSRDGNDNLRAEGVPNGRIHFVGNIMIDSVTYVLPKARQLNTSERYALTDREYVVVTLHRPSNVDSADTLGELLRALEQIGNDYPVLFPVHPRTKQRMAQFALEPPENSGVRLLEPIGYLEMLSLVDRAGLVITDSGGLQEETSFLGVPCLTARPNTERPVTIALGTNELVPSQCGPIVEAARKRFGAVREGAVIELWDGHAAERIADILERSV
ncbi:MAG: UDP-N-acetylglucosamine 2-epimerase (non-hydrolyzing) [Gemmatimonadota bacterium]|nr:UDP-N-acetylglucosamine 2-epimerase (non-hydrolyzing) [Gemmatimonadota bacterium]